VSGTCPGCDTAYLAVLHRNVSQCTALQCTVLCCTVLHGTA
jgi:hypothetical protein